MQRDVGGALEHDLLVRPDLVPAHDEVSLRLGPEKETGFSKTKSRRYIRKLEK